MALHTKADFARLCGLTSGNLSNYIQRKKVIPSGDYIDDALPQNAIFLGKRLKKEEEGISPDKNDKDKKEEDELKEKIGVKINKRIYSDPVINGPKTKNISKPGTGNNSDPQNYFQLEAQLKAQELEKKKAETDKLNLQVSKLQGEMIPVELVSQVLKQHNHSVATSLKDSVNDIFSIIVKEMEVKEELHATAKGKLVDVVNSVIKRSTQKMLSELKRITDDYENKQKEDEE